MRILVIAPEPFFSPRGTPFSVYYRTMITAEQGAEIDLLTYGEGQDVEIPGIRCIRIPRFGFLGPVPIGPSWHKLFLDAWMVLWTIGLLVRHRYAVVHAHEESAFWCTVLKPIFRFKMIYDMHSSLPQQLSNFEFTTSSVLIKTFEQMENLTLRKSDAVITICPELEDYVLAQGVDPNRQFRIENSIFEDVRLRGSQASACSGPKQPAPDLTRQTIVYAGSFEPYQGLDLLVRAFARVHRQRPDVQLVLVGGSSKQVKDLQAVTAATDAAAACFFTGQLPKSATRAYLEQARVLVSPRISGTNTPLKVYELLASGKPLVATNILSHTQVLTDDVCFLVDLTEESFAAGLLAALEDTERSARLVENARRLYQTEYSRAAYEDKMRRLLETLT
jgi:glycosyltransferase involved in cell wall biosynthesis